MKNLLKHSVRNLLIYFSPKWHNKKVCSADGLWNDYFKRAEGHMNIQWDEIIWPIIKDFDFEAVLELAPGAGRNTEKLAEISNTIHAIDMNDYVLEQLRNRFGKYSGKCNLNFYKNNGSNLKMINDGAISVIYSWDAMVHFDKTVIRDYVKEFSRVLKKNGMGFVHHSNLGTTANSDIRLNPHMRSNMSKELFAKYCVENGLQLIKQTDQNWGEITDCISIFRK